jgi:uncharacterized protein YqhQ
MTNETAQRIWLLCGTAFLAFVTMVGIVVFIQQNVTYLPLVLPVLCSFVVLTLNITILSSAGTSSSALLCGGRILLWLGLLLLITACVCSALNLMGII